MTETEDLFERVLPAPAPLSERMRPRSFSEVVGQDHLCGERGVLTRWTQAGWLPSMVLWGPPGSGKTSIAVLAARATKAAFEPLSATMSGTKELRAAIERASERRRHHGEGTVLFVDEIHRFHKGQQDTLLPHVERGTVVFIGATTEPPSFEVNAALLSRARVLVVQEAGPETIVEVLRRALTDSERGLGAFRLEAAEEVLRIIAEEAGGDVRRALGVLEAAAHLVASEADGRGSGRRIDLQVLGQVGANVVRHDKAGDSHYEVTSAFIKSLRNSDLDASLYWLARLLEGGEDPMFVARRIVVFAAEDIGNAEPLALVVAQSAASATHLVGMPEARILLSQAASFCALAPKSNAALRGIDDAIEDVRRHGSLPVPPHLRPGTTALHRARGDGVAYRYPHAAPHGVLAEFAKGLPEALLERSYGHPGTAGWEARAQARITSLRKPLATTATVSRPDDGAAEVSRAPVEWPEEKSGRPRGS